MQTLNRQDNGYTQFILDQSEQKSSRSAFLSREASRNGSTSQVQTSSREASQRTPPGPSPSPPRSRGQPDSRSLGMEAKAKSEILPKEMTDQDTAVEHASRQPLVESGDSGLNLNGGGNGEDEKGPICLRGDPLPPHFTGQTLLVHKNREFYGTKADISQDAWGAAVVAIVRNTTVISLKRSQNLPTRLNVMRLFVALGTSGCNIVLQVALLFFINEYVVWPSVRDVQQSYKEFASTALTAEGELDQVSWMDYEKKEEVCSMTMVNPTFYYCILSIWCLNSLQEVRSVDRMFRAIRDVQSVKVNTEMLCWEGDSNHLWGGTCFIVGLTSGLRFLLCFLVCVPRAIIAFGLLMMGCNWLSSSKNFPDMVMNTLALGFVINVDEILYQAVLPQVTQNQIQETKFFFIEGRRPKVLSEVEDHEWKGYRRTAASVILLVAFLIGYTQFYQQVLPPSATHLQRFCSTWLINDRQPVCDHYAWNSDSCYTMDAPLSDVGEDVPSVDWG